MVWQGCERWLGELQMVVALKLQIPNWSLKKKKREVAEQIIGSGVVEINEKLGSVVPFSELFWVLWSSLVLQFEVSAQRKLCWLFGHYWGASKCLQIGLDYVILVRNLRNIWIWLLNGCFSLARSASVSKKQSSLQKKAQLCNMNSTHPSSKREVFLTLCSLYFAYSFETLRTMFGLSVGRLNLIFGQYYYLLLHALSAYVDKWCALLLLNIFSF